MSFKTTVRVSYITFFTIAASLLNFVFQLVIARKFGAGTVTDVYFLAFSIPEWIMNITLFILPMTIIPAFSAQLAVGNEKKAWSIANSFISFLSLVLIAIIVLLIVTSGVLSDLVAANFEEENRTLYRQIFIILAPVILFTSITSIVMGIYYSYNHFLLPSITPIIQAFIMVMSVLLFHNTLGIFSAAAGTLAGAVIQLLILAVFLRKQQFSLTRELYTDDVKEIFKLIMPLLIGNIIFKSEVFINRYIASFLMIGSISFLSYGAKVARLFSNITSRGVATIFFPKFAKSFAVKDDELFQRDFETSVTSIILILLPIVSVILLFNQEIIYVLFYEGNFTREHAVKTGFALLFSFGVFMFFPLGDIAHRVYYAIKDTRSPVFIHLALFIPGILFKIVLARTLDYIGVALSSSLIDMTMIILLFVFLKRKLPFLKYRAVLINIVKMVASFAVATGIAYWINSYINYGTIYEEQNKIALLMILMAMFTGISAVYLLGNIITQNEIVITFVRKIKAKITG